MRKGYISGIGIAVAALIGLTACAPFGPGYGQPYGGPGGMMGGGMMGSGGMMGGRGRGNYNPDAKPITTDQAGDAIQSYLKAYYGDRLALTEIMEFARNYYAVAEEKDTGVHAMELLIDKYTGRVSPEMGPNMMWNTRYSPMGGMGGMGGMMGNYRGGLPTANMTVSAAQAKTLAQQYLETNLPGLTVAEADTFYGYYTLHTLKDGEIEGMLSVNGYTGAVWYHTWHGLFLGMKMYD
mgnify:CR=1 FL=1